MAGRLYAIEVIMMENYANLKKIPGGLVTWRMPYDLKAIVSGAANAGKAAKKAGKAAGSIKQQ